MSTIKTRVVSDSNNEIEFDYIHPKDNKRIRRKIAISTSNAERLCKLLEHIIENNLTINEVEDLVDTDPLFFENNNNQQLLSFCKTLYFNYNDKAPQDDDRCLKNIIEYNFLQETEFKICFLGRAGVGKSSIIRKMSVFSDTNINFPFIDTSRTTTFSAEYHFSKEKEFYQFAIKFIPHNMLLQQIWDCTERGINKAISKSKNFTDPTCNDDIISAFYNDPANVFDIRLLLGKHIHVNSKNRSLEKNRETVETWDFICEKCKSIATMVLQGTNSDSTADDFYIEKLSSLIKTLDNNEVKSAFEDLNEQISILIKQKKAALISNIKGNFSVYHINENDDYFMCKVSDILSNDFKNFISMFTSRNIEFYGNSLLPLVERLWIELPFNARMSDIVKSQKICCFDTIGIAHKADSNGSFDGSTKLAFDNVDAIVIVDDSRVNMDNNTGVILKHISSRVGFKKIYFALTFYDEFTKADFDPEEDMDEQKQSYLSKIQLDKTLEYLENSDYSKALNARMNNSTFYLSSLSNKQTSEDGYEQIDFLLNQIRIDSEISQSNLKVAKRNPSKKFISYDYKKLPLLYLRAQQRFIREQNDVYLSSEPPHFKTTEALTRRLMNKIASFTGSRTLTPVDDMYNAFISEMSNYISNPEEINLIGDNASIEQDCVEKFKTYLTDKISDQITAAFFVEEPMKNWKNLYLDYGTGVDRRRRYGIISTENSIAPDGNSILNNPSSSHLIFKLEPTFDSCIEEFENRLFISK